MTVLGPTPPRFPIGLSDYEQVRQEGYTYVDKTAWIADVLDGPAQALLVPRPRRFGKTLNMSTLRYFAERVPDEQRAARQALFCDTWVWNADDGAHRRHFARYPVVYLTFKDVKATSWDACSKLLVRLLTRALRRLDRLGHLSLEDSGDLGRVRQLCSDDTPIDAFADMLIDVGDWCRQTTGERFVLLIDEYDAPLHAAWQHGYLDEATRFFRAFLSGGLKDNEHLHRGVLTGILRVAKEGIFSGLNNLATASILSDDAMSAFGFTEGEVSELHEASGCADAMPAARTWYNGYTFGAAETVTMYNPWSVLRFLHEPGRGPQSFWKNTSDNVLIRDLLRRHAAAIGPLVETLLAGGTVEHTVDESVALPDLERNPGTVLDLLLFSGYLTVAQARATERGLVAELRIPNLEVRSIYLDTFGDWLSEATLQRAAAGVVALTRAILAGDAEIVEDALGALMVQMLSYHDVAGEPVEAVYQAFVVGLLVHMEPTHVVRSNREAGYGRADVLITPRQPGPGAVLELKRLLSRETPEQALDRAAAQLVERAYAAEVHAAGATVVYQYAVVFDGKRCHVRRV